MNTKFPAVSNTLTDFSSLSIVMSPSASSHPKVNTVSAEIVLAVDIVICKFTTSTSVTVSPAVTPVPVTYIPTSIVSNSSNIFVRVTVVEEPLVTPFAVEGAIILSESLHVVSLSPLTKLVATPSTSIVAVS